MIPFYLGRTYKTQGGKSVKFVKIHNAGTDYETMEDENGVYRYTRRLHDLGRCTGTNHDFSDPENVIPLLYPDDKQEYFLQVSQGTHSKEISVNSLSEAEWMLKNFYDLMWSARFMTRTTSQIEHVRVLK